MAPARLRRWLLGVVSLQPGQGSRTFLTGAYLCLIIASYLMLRSVAKSEFIERFGADNLPYVTIATGVLVGLFVTLYVVLARRFNPPALIVGTQLFFIVNLLVFWWLARVEVRWMYPVYYVWVSTYGIISPTQVWILANYLFTTREAKRAFGVVGAGGILGGILGGLMTGVLVGYLGTANLRLVVVGVLAVACVLVGILARHRLPSHSRSEEQPPPRQLLDSLRIVANSPHLRLVAGLVFVTAVATKMVDWQFNKVAEVAFDTEDARTAFFGYFEGSAGLAALLFQIFLTSRILMLIGLGGAILIFPTILTVGTLGTVFPAISKWFAGILRGSDLTLKHSIDRSSRELFYLPVSRTIKLQVKSAIDMMADRLGDGVSGLVQLAMLALLALIGTTELGKIGGMGLVNLVFLGTWLLFSVRLRRSYVGELSRSIEEGRLRVESWHEVLAGAEALRAVESALASDEEATVKAALDLVARNPEWDLTETLCMLAKDGSPEVRARALAILLSPEHPDLPEGVTDAFQQEDQDLLADIVELQLAADPAGRERVALRILNRAGGDARGAWIALMVRRLGPEFRPVARGLLEELLRPTSPSTAREVAATAIGMIPAETGMSDLLPALLDDGDSRVAAAAARSASAVGGDDLLARIVPLLGGVGTGGAARQALQSRGDDAVAVLEQSFRDEGLDRRARLRIPSVLAGVDSSTAIAALTELLGSEDPEMAMAAGDALYRIRLKKPEWSLLPPREGRALILTHARKCGELADLVAALQSDRPGEPSDAWRLLLASLQAAHRRRHDAIFRMLCLNYPPREILNCKRSLTAPSRELRANAAELLDNLVPRKLWRELLPILYPEEFGTNGGARLKHTPRVEEIVLRLVEGEDDWLRTCALNFIGESRLAGTLRPVERAESHPHPWVRETAVRARERIDGRADSLDSMSVVEKVVALQAVEVFRGIPPEQLAWIAAVAREETFPAGAALCTQNDPPGDMFVVLGGRVKVEKDGAPLGELSAGDALGTWALFEDEISRVSATAADETRTLRIDRMGFEDALQEHPEIARSLIRQLIRRLRDLAVQ